MVLRFALCPELYCGLTVDNRVLSKSNQSVTVLRVSKKYKSNFIETFSKIPTKVESDSEKNRSYFCAFVRCQSNAIEACGVALRPGNIDTTNNPLDSEGTGSSCIKGG